MAHKILHRTLRRDNARTIAARQWRVQELARGVDRGTSTGRWGPEMLSKTLPGLRFQTHTTISGFFIRDSGLGNLLAVLPPFSGHQVILILAVSRNIQLRKLGKGSLSIIRYLLLPHMPPKIATKDLKIHCIRSSFMKY